MILETEKKPKGVQPSEGPSDLRHRRRRTFWVTRWGVMLGLAALGLAACGGGVGSTTSSGATGSGGTGVGWTVQVKVFSSTLSLSKAETTSVIVTVRDAAGGSALKGTRVCLSTTHGLIWVDELGKDSPVIAGCVSTSNDIGQLFGSYVPLKVGTDQVQASAQGAFGSATITVVE